METTQFFDDLYEKPVMVDRGTQVYNQDNINTKTKLRKGSIDSSSNTNQKPKLKKDDVTKSGGDVGKKTPVTNINTDFRSKSYRNLITTSHIDFMNNLERRVHDFLKQSRPFF